MYKEMMASQEIILDSSEGTSCRAIIDLTRKDPFTDLLMILWKKQFFLYKKQN